MVKSLNLKKCEIINYYSYHLINHYVEALTHIKSISFVEELFYPLKWIAERVSLELHQDVNFHSACIEICKLTSRKFKEHNK